MVTAILLWRPWNKAQNEGIYGFVQQAFVSFEYMQVFLFSRGATTPGAVGMYPGMASLLCGLQLQGCNLDKPKL